MSSVTLPLCPVITISYGAFHSPNAIPDRSNPSIRNCQAIQQSVENVCAYINSRNQIGVLFESAGTEFRNMMDSLCTLSEAGSSSHGVTIHAEEDQLIVDVQDLLSTPSESRTMEEVLPGFIAHSLILDGFDLTIDPSIPQVTNLDGSLHTPLAYLLSSYKSTAVEYLKYFPKISREDLNGINPTIEDFRWLLSIAEVPDELFYSQLSVITKSALSSWRNSAVYQKCIEIHDAFHSEAVKRKPTESGSERLIHLPKESYVFVMATLYGHNGEQRIFSPVSFVSRYSNYYAKRLNLLGFAILSNKPAVVEDLLELGIDYTRPCSFKGGGSLSPLRLAVENGYKEIVDVLLRKKPTKNLTTITDLIRTANGHKYVKLASWLPYIFRSATAEAHEYIERELIVYRMRVEEEKCKQSYLKEG